MSDAAPDALAPGADAVALNERVRVLDLLRVALVVLVIVIRLAAPDLFVGSMWPLLTLTAGYALVCTAAAALWRTTGGRGLVLIGVCLLVDGCYLAAVQQLAVDPAGVVRLLVVPHIVAVTLAASYRTGLKVVLWHTLLLYTAHHARAAGLLDRPAAGEPSDALAVFVALLWVVAVATATFSAVNERELRRRRVDLQVLARMASDLEHESGPAATAEVLLHSVLDAHGFRRGAVISLRSGRPDVIARRGTVPDDTVELSRTGALARACDSRSAVLVRALDPEADRGLDELLPAASHVVVVPLIADGTPIGALVVERGTSWAGGLQRRTLAMTEQMAAHAALALRNAWLLEEVRTLADTDGLTRIPNRRTFDAMLTREVARSRRTALPVSLLMLDIDEFKALNDAHGHQVGDDVLRTVAGVLLDRIRQMDVAARYGGEEFAVILPSCDERSALEIAERFREWIAIEASAVPVTVSVGVATYPHDASGAITLIEAADSALFASKRSGRNRVTSYARGELTGVSTS